MRGRGSHRDVSHDRLELFGVPERRGGAIVVVGSGGGRVDVGREPGERRWPGAVRRGLPGAFQHLAL